MKLAAHIADQLQAHIADNKLGSDDLLFTPTLLVPPTDPSRLQLVDETSTSGSPNRSPPGSSIGTAPSAATTPAGASANTAAAPTPPTKPTAAPPAETRGA